MSYCASDFEVVGDAIPNEATVRCPVAECLNEFLVKTSTVDGLYTCGAGNLHIECSACNAQQECNCGDLY